MRPEQCFKCLRYFTDSNSPNPKLATSLLSCIKCGQLNLGKPALELHYKVCHSSPAPHTLCDGCATSFGRTPERLFRTDNFDAMRQRNRHSHNTMTRRTKAKDRNTVHRVPKAFGVGSPSERSTAALQSGKGSTSMSLRPDSKDSRPGCLGRESIARESAEKKRSKFKKFFK